MRGTAEAGRLWDGDLGDSGTGKKTHRFGIVLKLDERSCAGRTFV